MKDNESVYDRSYAQYLEQLNGLPLERIAPALGGKVKGGALELPLLGKTYSVSCGGIFDPSGKRPAYDICVILSRYLIMCPDVTPQEDQWVSFRDFKDSGPLTVYFNNDVEGAIASHFKGNLDGLKRSGRSMSGGHPNLDVVYDLAMQFDALPRLPVVLLFNDADDEFPATCSVLFERRSEKYLDAECIAMVGRQLFERLRHAHKPA